MEQFPVPQAERVVGDKELSPEFVAEQFDVVPVDAEGKVITGTREILKKLFSEVSAEKIKEFELEKTPEDVATIELATNAVKNFAQSFGKEQFVQLPIENIHFLKEGGVKEWTGGRLGNGSHATVLGQVFVERRDDIETAITTFHELWHALASYKAIQVTTEGKLDWYRAGLAVRSRDAKEEWFQGLDEALTGIMTKRFVEEVLSKDSRFKIQIEALQASGGHINTTREREVANMMRLIKTIGERNKGKHESFQEILNIFLKGEVTGNILPAARIIERTYGKGAFRKLGGVKF